ncbi:hypothetical protein F5J12DRAFT_692540, partial [Pisolithus orientalis]|uniref:uncharacterized protein n=1 Tax=Pisolithus orientalis TaxID=936130 RepID=UPI00222533FF
PFADRDEWELAKFLHTHMMQTQINEFLKLHWVSNSSPLVTSKSKVSFKSAGELLSLLDTIPKGPSWHCTKIKTKGYIMKGPIHLFWHDTPEITWELFGNLVFTKHMEYDSYHVFKGTE